MSGPDPAASPGHVGQVARALGFAGLLPPLGMVVLLALGPDNAPFVIALRSLVDLYAGLICSFLGGMWWSFAMRRTRRQGLLAAIAVAPSLVAAALLVAASVAQAAWPSILLGLTVILTLPVDAHLARTGEAPAGWMSLRVPLSLGLGLLTIAAGVLGR